MSNPRDWFRRRRILPHDGTFPLTDDPFAEDGILDLGQGAMMLHQAAAPEIGERAAGGERGIAAPSPFRSAKQRREGRVIERSAFAIRPEIVRPPALRTESLRPEIVQAHRSPTSGNSELGEAALASFTAHRGGTSRSDGIPRPEPNTVSAAARPPLEHAPPQPRAAGEGTDENAAFTVAAPGASWMRGGHARAAETARVSERLREAFTPTRPKHDVSLFSGRYKQMQRIIAAIEEERAHVVIYGERGSGKTSLANVLSIKAEEAGYFVLRFACSSELGFEDIFRSLLRRIPSTFLAEGIGATHRAGVENFEELLPAHFGVAELVSVFERIYDRHVILIIDEYDRITGEETKNKLAETIKIMSDAAAPVTLLLIGVADDVRQLFGKHPSLQRTLVTVPMPLMSRREIDGIIGVGEQKAGLHFEADVRQSIVEFAQGLPYYAQLLGLFAARSAVRRRSGRVERQDLRHAVQRAAEEAESRIKEAYGLALGSHDNTSFQDALFHAARCRTDEFGTFTAADVAAAGRTGEAEIPLLSLQYPLKKLTEPERGAVLRRIPGTNGLRYQFSSQMLRHYVLVRQAEQRGLV